jgi:hypothetical protein
MCSYLEWQLNMDPTTLHDFQARVQLDFACPRIHQWYTPRTLLPTKVREIIKTQVRVPLFLHSTRAYHCRKTPTLFPVHRSEHTPHPSRYPRGLPLGLDVSHVLLSKDAPVIPSPSIQTYPSSLPIPQRPPTRPQRLPRPVVERHPRYSQSIDPNIPLIPLNTPEASHSALTSPASSC